MSISKKAIFLAENRFYDAQYKWRARKLIGHWHWYSKDGTYETYDITDSANVWVNQNDLKEEEGFAMLAYMPAADTLSLYIDCGGEKYHHISFKNDTLLLVGEDYYSKTPVLKYFALKHDRTKCNALLDFYGNLPISINLPTSQRSEIDLTSKSLKSHLYIGQPKKYLQQKYSPHQYLILLHSERIIQQDEISSFISTELDKLDDSERQNLEIFLNADQNTPQSMLDSIKNIIDKDFPNLKRYRIVLQAETGKLGKIKW